jgi:hypothetical protein
MEDYRILVDIFSAMKPVFVNGVVTDTHSWTKVGDRISLTVDLKTSSQGDATVNICSRGRLDVDEGWRRATFGPASAESLHPSN